MQAGISYKIFSHKIHYVMNISLIMYEWNGSFKISKSNSWLSSEPFMLSIHSYWKYFKSFEEVILSKLRKL